MPGTSTTAPPDRSSAPERPAATGLQALWSRALTWISLFGAAIGFFSFFDELMPNLVRLSFVLKALTGAYTFARDWVWDRVQWLFSLVHLRIPDIPEVWLDAFTVLSLVLAALNFESIQRYGRSLLLDFGRDVVQYTLSWFGGSFHLRETLFDTKDRTVSMLLGFWVLGFAFRGVGSIVGLEVETIALPQVPRSVIAIAQPSIEAAVLGIVPIGCAMLGAFLGGDLDVPPQGLAEILARTLVVMALLVPSTFSLALTGILNGWRSVVLALALVIVLIGANRVAIYALDPFVRSPPQWVCAMVNANPDALPEPRCGL